MMLYGEKDFTVTVNRGLLLIFCYCRCIGFVINMTIGEAVLGFLVR